MNWEQYFKIDTEGFVDGNSDEHHHRYEPTPYPILEKLLDSGYLNHCHTFIDIGCGKGRVPIFFAYTLGIQSIGIDYDETLIEYANKMLDQTKVKHHVSFMHIKAEDYHFIKEDAIFFFNPFSTTIFQSVLSHIIQSYYEYPRCIRLFFYYMDDDMLAYMMSQNEFIFIDEIDCEDIFQDDERERIMIFESI